MANVGDVVKRGDHVKVKVLSISGTKLSLSMRVSVCDAAIYSTASITLTLHML